jgi:ribosomal-protein-alanine N-acetyltransferase
MNARVRRRESAAVAIRGTAPEDLDTIAALEASTFSQPWSRQSFADLAATPFAKVLVAANEAGAVLGYAVVYFASDQSELANLAVAVSHRGQGIGRRLLDGAMAEAMAHGATAMFLEVRASNAAAQSLYESAGFERVGIRRRYYQQPVEDALVLRADLHPPSRADRGA